jgi:hypothetical protein
MLKFLIYSTEEEALAKAEEEGRAQNLPYWQDPVNTTKYLTGPIYTDDGEFALDVTEYTTLTAEEQSATVTTLNIA